MKTIKLILTLSGLILANPYITNAQKDNTSTKSKDNNKVTNIENYYKTNQINKLGVYVLGGVTVPFTDVVKSRKIGFTAGIQAQYSLTYYLEAALDIQLGKLEAGNNPTLSNPKELNFENKYLGTTLTIRFSPLKFLKSIPYNSFLYYISNVYVGTGIGILNSKVTANTFSDPTFSYNGDYKGTDATIPFEFGINLPLVQLSNKNMIYIGLNYRYNFVMSDNIDGYDTPSYINEHKDVYNTFNVGIGYRF